MTRSRQQGVALVLVLWITVLVTVASGAFAIMARVDRLEANTLLWGTRARLAAEGAIQLAAAALRDTDDLYRPIGDGRPYFYAIDDALVEVRITDERGKLDLNAIEEPTLITLFTNHGLEQGEAELLAGAVMDWRDADELERVNGAELPAYEEAGLEIGPANRPFLMTQELLQVLGMTYALYERIEPGLTVYSRVGEPDLAFAPFEALMAVPEITPEEALNFVEERQSMEPGTVEGFSLPTGQLIMAQGRGLTYSIVAKATMPNGIWEQIEATIRLGGTQTGQPFRVLRWREGFHQP
ncbi:MAG: type II secretion system protein GspK [Xanthomonadales bacterium]|nr:type II secretion system protein GspK [Xanthomonadales bacterium]